MNSGQENRKWRTIASSHISACPSQSTQTQWQCTHRALCNVLFDEQVGCVRSFMSFWSKSLLFLAGSMTPVFPQNRVGKITSEYLCGYKSVDCQKTMSVSFSSFCCSFKKIRRTTDTESMRPRDFPQVTSCWRTCCWTSSNVQLLPVSSSWHRWPTPGPGFDWMTSTARGAMTPWRPMDRASWLMSSSHAHSPNGYKVRWDGRVTKECMHMHTW